MKWTQKMRDILYSRLVEKFGQYSTWEKATNPGDAKLYDEFLSEIAEGLGKITGQTFTKEAVANQIAWGISKQQEIKNVGHNRNFIMNRAAALESGFITSKDLPKASLFEY